MKEDPVTVLGLERNSSQKGVTEAYRQLARDYSPAGFPPFFGPGGPNHSFDDAQNPR